MARYSGLALKSLAAAILSFGALPAAYAQEQYPVVASYGGWGVYQVPDECWVSARPQASTVTRNGGGFSMDRGEVSLKVTFRAPDIGRPETSFNAGAAQVDDAAVEAVIDYQSYPFFAGNGDNNIGAWPQTLADDARFVAAMKSGTTATISSFYPGDVEATDTFSLQGFGAALKDARTRCN